VRCRLELAGNALGRRWTNGAYALEGVRMACGRCICAMALALAWVGGIGEVTDVLLAVECCRPPGPKLEVDIIDEAGVSKPTMLSPFELPRLRLD
jgi:hypothetical protein